MLSMTMTTPCSVRCVRYRPFWGRLAIADEPLKHYVADMCIVVSPAASPSVVPW
jgi:hypothetical protein